MYIFNPFNDIKIYIHVNFPVEIFFQFYGDVTIQINAPNKFPFRFLWCGYQVGALKNKPPNIPNSPELDLHWGIPLLAILCKPYGILYSLWCFCHGLLMGHCSQQSFSDSAPAFGYSCLQTCGYLLQPSQGNCAFQSINHCRRARRKIEVLWAFEIVQPHSILWGQPSFLCYETNRKCLNRVCGKREVDWKPLTAHSTFPRVLTSAWRLDSNLGLRGYFRSAPTLLWGLQGGGFPYWLHWWLSLISSSASFIGLGTFRNTWIPGLR